MPEPTEQPDPLAHAMAQNERLTEVMTALPTLLRDAVAHAIEHYGEVQIATTRARVVAEADTARAASAELAQRVAWAMRVRIVIVIAAFVLVAHAINTFAPDRIDAMLGLIAAISALAVGLYDRAGDLGGQR